MKDFICIRDYWLKEGDEDSPHFEAGDIVPFEVMLDNALCYYGEWNIKGNYQLLYVIDAKEWPKYFKEDISH